MLPLYPEIKPYARHKVRASDTHELYVDESGIPHGIPVLFVLTAIYGTSHGLVEGAEKALIAELAAGSGKGKAFGSYNMLIGLAALAASTTFGLVWDRFGSAVAFTSSGVVALVAAGVLLAVVPIIGSMVQSLF